jgi:hypothetical protein
MSFSEKTLDLVTHNFQIDGQFVKASPYGNGHINDTFLASYKTPQGERQFVHQRINHSIFKEPGQLMENIARVTRYARSQIEEAGGDPERETLNLVPALNGQPFFVTPQGDYWRTYTFIQGASSYDKAPNLSVAYHAARSFGNFQKMLDQLPGERLHETIPFFHHTRRRFESFLAALEADICQRAQYVRPEIDFILQRQADTSLVVNLLAQGQLPERVTHNDTKFNNVLIDDQTGQGLCVIDLDTMMPGSALYDFGDLVRMGCATAVEDETDLSQVGINLVLFEALAHGYLDATRSFITPLESSLLVFGGKLITLEQGIRFLGDYLNGDRYYKTRYPEHNRDRARTQIKMVAEIEKYQTTMEGIVKKYV